MNYIANIFQAADFKWKTSLDYKLTHANILELFVGFSNSCYGNYTFYQLFENKRWLWDTDIVS